MTGYVVGLPISTRRGSDPMSIQWVVRLDDLTPDDRAIALAQYKRHGSTRILRGDLNDGIAMHTWISMRPAWHGLPSYCRQIRLATVGLDDEEAGQ